ncbi:MAG: hypothetical protein ACE15E_19310 [Acidobacteriota bacterium]
MTFEQAGQAFAGLQSQWRAGRISWEQFQASAAQLRVQDSTGAWWQIDPASGQWIVWDGVRWVQPGSPSANAAAMSAAQAAQAQPAPATAPAAQPQRGPSPTPVTDLPIGAAPTGWGQILWDIVTVLGCGAISGAWYWYSGMAETAPDTKSCIAMVALPLALILSRPLTDRLLIKLQPFVARIPRMVLLGMGLAVPFLVANQLYGRYTEFEYMFKTVVISTLLSYVIFRTPLVRPRGGQRPANNGGVR